MKQFSLLIIIGLILLVLAICVPYMEYDVREFHGYFSLKPRRYIARDSILHGSQTILTFIPLVILSIPSSLFLIRNSKSNTIRLIIFSGVFSGIIILLFFALTAKPSFYNGYYNVSLLQGFWSSSIGIILILVGSIISYRNNKNSF